LLSLPFSNGILFVRTSQGWHTGYRPTAIRITYTGAGITRLNVRDTDNNDLADPGGVAYTSGDIRTLDFTPDLDLASILIRTAGINVYFTNIEFYLK